MHALEQHFLLHVEEQDQVDLAELLLEQQALVQIAGVAVHDEFLGELSVRRTSP